MASLAMRAFLRVPRRIPEPKAAPALELVKPEPSSWDAVVSRLLEDWEPLAPEAVLELYLVGWPEDRREAFEERAAVLEVDAGFSREEAERRALEELTGRKVHNGSNGNLSGRAAA